MEVEMSFSQEVPKQLLTFLLQSKAHQSFQLISSHCACRPVGPNTDVIVMSWKGWAQNLHSITTSWHHQGRPSMLYRSICPPCCASQVWGGRKAGESRQTAFRGICEGGEGGKPIKWEFGRMCELRKGGEPSHMSLGNPCLPTPLHSWEAR